METEKDARLLQGSVRRRSLVFVSVAAALACPGLIITLPRKSAAARRELTAADFAAIAKAEERRRLKAERRERDRQRTKPNSELRDAVTPNSNKETDL
jgi:hypothetical protein